MRQTTIILLFSPLMCLKLYSQQTVRSIKTGNDFYKKQQFEKAQQEYNKAIGKDNLDSIAKFNLGNTLYRLGKKDEAIKTFKNQVGKEKEPVSISKIYYNTGVIFSSEKKLEESIDAYKNALRQNPDDKDARENLQKALLELKKKNPPPPPKENKKKQQPQMNPKDAEQKLKQLEQKEKDLQQRMQKEKAKGSPQPKDW